MVQEILYTKSIHYKFVTVLSLGNIMHFFYSTINFYIELFLSLFSKAINFTGKDSYICLPIYDFVILMLFFSTFSLDIPPHQEKEELLTVKILTENFLHML